LNLRLWIDSKNPANIYAESREVLNSYFELEICFGFRISIFLFQWDKIARIL